MIAGCEIQGAQIRRAKGTSPWVLVCEHAGNQIPQSLGTLGLSDADLNRHITWDIGIQGVAEKLCAQLDATLIIQPWSRLVIDCNRRPDDPDLVALESDGTIIPGNRNLSRQDIQNRIETIHAPFHKCIKDELDQHKTSEQAAVLVTLHSFTPKMTDGAPRPWHIGVIYNRDRRLADPLLGILGGLEGIQVGDNEPYSMTDDNVYTLPHHAERRGIPTVEIELRQDLIVNEEGQHHWADLLTAALNKARKELIESSL